MTLEVSYFHQMSVHMAIPVLYSSQVLASRLDRIMALNTDKGMDRAPPVLVDRYRENVGEFCAFSSVVFFFFWTFLGGGGGARVRLAELGDTDQHR